LRATILNNTLTIFGYSLEFLATTFRRTQVATPGTSLKESQSIADWLPLLGSIVQALSGMAEDDMTANDKTARDGESSPGRTAR
jgi:hypothetical protein